jgi:uncharacterized protein (TIGR02285 family)
MFLASVLLAHSAAAQDRDPLEPVILTFNERIPYIIALSDGSAKGLTATPAANAFRTAGIPFVWKKLPTNRQLAELKMNAGKQCAIGWFKNPERMQYFKFTDAIYRDLPTILIARSNFDTQPADTLDSILLHRDVRVLVKDMFSYGQYIDNLLGMSKSKLVVTTNENTQMVQMIIAGRADFMFASEEEARYLIDQTGSEAYKLRIVRPSDMPQGERRYIICSKQVEDSVIDKLNAAINSNQKYSH